MNKEDTLLVLKDRKYDKLKFEYQELRERILHDSKIAYTIMTIMIPFSLGIMGWIIVSGITNIYILIAGATVSTAGLTITYLIERRFDYTNNLRIAQISHIEKKLNMLNQEIFRRIYKKEKLPQHIKEKLNEHKFITKNISVHHYSFIYIYIFVFAWLLLINKSLSYCYFKNYGFWIFLIPPLFLVLLYFLTEPKKTLSNTSVLEKKCKKWGIIIISFIIMGVGLLLIGKGYIPIGIAVVSIGIAFFSIYLSVESGERLTTIANAIFMEIVDIFEDKRILFWQKPKEISLETVIWKCKTYVDRAYYLHTTTKIDEQNRHKLFDQFYKLIYKSGIDIIAGGRNYKLRVCEDGGEKEVFQELTPKDVNNILEIIDKFRFFDLSKGDPTGLDTIEKSVVNLLIKKRGNLAKEWEDLIKRWKNLIPKK